MWANKIELHDFRAFKNNFEMNSFESHSISVLTGGIQIYQKIFTTSKLCI